MTSKKCLGCSRIKDLNLFNIAKNGLLGRTSKCKECLKEQYLQTTNYRRNKQEKKQCTGCGLFKLRSEYHFSNKKRGWLKADCKECRAKKIFNPNSNRHTPPCVREARRLQYKRNFYKKRFAENPEIYRIQTIKRRSLLRKAEGSFTKEEWIAKLEEYKYLCKYCGKKLDKNTATKDHVIPLSKNGSNWIDNIVPACHRCNSGKCDSIYYKPRYIYGA